MLPEAGSWRRGSRGDSWRVSFEDRPRLGLVFEHTACACGAVTGGGRACSRRVHTARSRGSVSGVRGGVSAAIANGPHLRVRAPASPHLPGAPHPSPPVSPARAAG